MLFLLFGTALVIWGLSVDNGTLTTVGWVAWAIAVIVIWMRSAGRFGMRAIMTRRMLRDIDRMRVAQRTATRSRCGRWAACSR